MNLQNLNVVECSTLIYYNSGDRIVRSNLIELDDAELISIIKAKYSKKWELLENISPDEIGAVKTKVVTDSETITGNNIDESTRKKAESGLNSDIYIDTDKTNYNVTRNKDELITRESKEMVIDNNLKNQNILEHTFDLCYNIAKDVADVMTLDFY